MLEVVIIALEWAKGDSEPNWHIGFQHCAFWEDLEDCHVFSIQVFLLLGDPVEIQFALQPVGDFYFFLTAEGHHLAEAEV